MSLELVMVAFWNSWSQGGWVAGESGSGVGAAVVHVEAGEVGAGADFDEFEGVGVAGVDVDAAVVGGHHAAAEFTGEVGIFVGVGFVGFGAVAEDVGADGGVGAFLGEGEDLPVGAGHGGEGLVPEAFGIAAEEGEDFAEGHGGAERGPAGAGVEGGVDA
ncbi:MAG TPA: hypothetical protein VHQ47_20790 [Phycisphaerae bacterium]|nr:hypothetical protein [Phycisphaerae bacterium]